MRNMIKAVFFDIDGTLMPFTTREISPATLQSLYLLHDRGIKLFIATGRPPGQLSLLSDRFNSFPWDGFLLMNGQYCTDGNMVPFHQMPIPAETLQVLVPWLKEHADFACSFYELDYMYDIRFNEGMYSYLSSIGKEDRMPPVEDPVRALTHTTYQVCPYIPEEKDPEFLALAPGLKSARWTPSFADVIPSGGGKPVGMKHALEHFGLTMEEAMAFGDGGNDIDMLKAAKIGVAMGNANDKVKAAADYVTDDCDRDGIVTALKHFGIL